MTNPNGSQVQFVFQQDDSSAETAKVKEQVVSESDLSDLEFETQVGIDPSLARTPSSPTEDSNVTPIRKDKKAPPKLSELESNRIMQIEIDAQVRIKIAEFKTEFLSDHLGEAKAMRYQMQQLLKPLLTSNNPQLVKLAKRILMIADAQAEGTIQLVKKHAKAEKKAA